MPARRIGSVRLGHAPGSIPKVLLEATDEAAALDQYEDRLREFMEERTEEFLHQLYGHVGPRLARRFEDFMRHADEEVAALVEVARSFGIEVEESELVAPDAAADRITWEPVARSATLALFNWLVEHARDEQRVLLATEWAQEAAAATDFDVFRAKTSLTEPDARIAIAEAAQAIVSWEALETPQFLLYRGEYLSVWADGGKGTIGALTTAEQPLVYVPGEPEPVIRSEGEEAVHVELSRESVELVPIAPLVEYSEIGDCLVVSGAIEAEPALLLSTGFCLKPERGWTYESFSEGLRVRSTGRIAFSAPSTVGIHVFEDGLLLERDLSKDISFADSIGFEELPGVGVGEHGPGDAKSIARFVNE